MDLILENAFPINNQQIDAAVKPYIAQKIASIPVKDRLPFIPVTEDTKQKVRNIINALAAYDTAPSNTAMALIKSTLDDLDMDGFRFKNYPDTVFFYPKTVAAKSVAGLCLWWHFGKVCVPLQPDTYNNPVLPLGFTSEHEGKDGTYMASARLFLRSGAKFMISNTINSRTKQDPADPAHYLSDAAHNTQTSLTAAMMKLKSLNPNFAVINLHGISFKDPNKAKPEDIQRLIIVNNVVYQFTKTAKSFPTLFSLAALTHDVAKGTLFMASSLPGNVVLPDGRTMPLTAKVGTTGITSYTVDAGSLYNTNLLGHIVQNGGISNPGKDFGFSMHLEMDPYFRLDENYITQLVKSINLAMQMWLRYQNDLHNVWNLNTTNPDVFNNMSKYPSLFGKDVLDFINAQKGITIPVDEDVPGIPGDDIDDGGDDDETPTVPVETTDPTPTDPTPVEPTNPTPTDPTPVEPTDPTPTDPTPVEPTDPTPTDPTPVEPTNPTPVDPTPVEPTDPTPTDPTPVEPTDPTPTDPTPVEPTDPTPTDPTPVEPTNPTPVDPTPVVTQPQAACCGCFPMFSMTKAKAATPAAAAATSTAKPNSAP